MCCARTAALQGGYEKQKVNASRDFLQHSLHHVQKSLESYAKNMFGSREWHVPKFMLANAKNHRQMCLKGSKTLSRPPKIEPGATRSPKKTTNMI